jgi:hypothetical protein
MQFFRGQIDKSSNYSQWQWKIQPATSTDKKTRLAFGCGVGLHTKYKSLTHDPIAQ